MTNLVKTVLATIQLPGMSARRAASTLIDDLNADLGAEYTTNYLSKWRRADRAIPQPVQDWMLRVCISHAVRTCGGSPPESDEQLDQLAAMLCPPKR